MGIFILSLPDRAVGDIYYKTYSNGKRGYFWKSISIIEIRSAEKLKYTYDNEDDTNIINYLKRVFLAVMGIQGVKLAPPPPLELYFSFSN
jgi:hypothetical protein